MQFRNTEIRFGVVAQFFHWAIVALIITQYTLVEIFDDMPLGMAKIRMIGYHKAVGMTVLMLAVPRLIWRWINPVPTLPGNLKPYERHLAHISHFLLYLLIFAIPLSGWIMSSVAKIPVSYFGWFTFPDFIGQHKSLVDPVKEVHEVLNVILLVTVTVHVAAALKHHFILKDDVLKRMLLPWFGRDKD